MLKHKPTKQRQPKKSILKQQDDSISERAAKSLAWGDLVILEFASILGDNPATTEGCPLTLDWTPQHEEVVGIDYYEYLRRQMKPRRSRGDLRIPGGQRDSFLLSVGYSLPQILKTSKDLEKIRSSRRTNMTVGRFESFKNVLSKSWQGSKLTTIAPKERVLAARSG